MQPVALCSPTFFRPVPASTISLQFQVFKGVCSPTLITNVIKRACPLGQASRAFEDLIGFEGTKAFPGGAA